MTPQQLIRITRTLDRRASVLSVKGGGDRNRYLSVDEREELEAIEAWLKYQHEQHRGKSESD